MRLILTTAVLLGMASAAHAGMGVSFDWGPTKKCFDPKSPPMQLSGVPEGTAKLDIRMVDRNAINFSHGGGKITYTGNNSLAYGAFKYKGPCPPTGSHNYVFTVKALDAKGKTIATAKASKKFP